MDGFLRLHDIHNLRLNADLVVLSACRTALGKELRGEGLIGLTRGFFYAGAPAVVASLWDVRDRSTAELMTRCYRNDAARQSAAGGGAARGANRHVARSTVVLADALGRVHPSGRLEEPGEVVFQIARYGFLVQRALAAAGRAA